MEAGSDYEHSSSFGWDERSTSRKSPGPFSGWNGNFFPLPHQFVSSFCSVSSQHTKTEFSKSSLCSLGVFFSPNSLLPSPLSPSQTDMQEETYAAIPTSWQLVLLEWDLAQGGSSCLERVQRVRKNSLNVSEGKKRHTSGLRLKTVKAQSVRRPLCTFTEC